MKIYKQSKYIVLGLLFVYALASCSSITGNTRNPFDVSEDGTVLELDGTIGTNTLEYFDAIYAENPNIKLLSIKNCNGSVDDDTNFLLMKRIYDAGISTYLQDDGEIASGGVDLFMAGVTRSMGTNTSIGVHEWAIQGLGGDSAQDYPRGSEEHLIYIRAFMDVGYTQEQAEDFYYFSIYAAKHNDIHWMTQEEIVEYGLLKE